ncbi:vWA domain-containing protein [Alterinioella nitratireducens]|uniref:vWA domain-containing protein n=1 Tax=Alterinioella nitratireducens TaxID=2735915 RepID=UPI001556317B|nr:VWA domain-containing protein [Alterinioella nitratireducens]NPD21611.1 VWA domain-containing protein [Alterinioella nitratireducens]
MQALPHTEGRLVDNIVHFTRALRKAGVPVGTAQLRNAIEAVMAAGFTRKDDFFVTLRATLISRPEHFETFEQVFALFWRDPEFLERMVREMLPLMQVMQPDQPPPKPAQRRAADGLWGDQPGAGDAPEREELEVDAKFSMSDRETLMRQDFEQMSAAELTDAKTAIRTLRLPAPPILTRRYRASSSGGRADVKAMLRRSLHKGGEIDRLSLKQRRLRPPNLVVICDISGSMSVYSRMMMHFLHALTWAPDAGWGKVHGFTFGTRLTNVTRSLHLRDIDMALDDLGREASDWKGGTRIGEALHRFNRDWSRRVLGQGAVVLLITDGLERGDVGQLRAEAERLAKSCKRLIWLNPLLRWDGFSPQAAGIKALLPLVDSFHSCHSLDSLAELGAAFARHGAGRPSSAAPS